MVKQCLADPGLILVLKDGYSYGSFLDEKIAEYCPNCLKVTVENLSMLEMIYKKRVDYFFIAPEEADGLISSSGLAKEEFKYIHFSDMPMGEKRYILCSQQVEDEVIEKLKVAIDTYMNKETNGVAPQQN